MKTGVCSFRRVCRFDEGRSPLALAGVPPRPAGEVQDRHVGDPGGTEDGRAVAVRTGEKRLHLSIDHRMAQRRIHLAERGLRPEAGRFHLERLEDARPDRFVPGLAADPLDHGAHDYIAQIRIGEGRPRFGFRRAFAPLPDQPVPHLVEVALPGHRVTVQTENGFIVGRQPSRMRQEPFECDGPHTGIHLLGKLGKDVAPASSSSGASPPPPSSPPGARSSPSCPTRYGTGR